MPPLGIDIQLSTLTAQRQYMCSPTSSTGTRKAAASATPDLRPLLGAWRRQRRRRPPRRRVDPRPRRACRPPHHVRGPEAGVPRHGAHAGLPHRRLTQVRSPLHRRAGHLQMTRARQTMLSGLPCGMVSQHTSCCSPCSAPRIAMFPTGHHLRPPAARGCPAALVSRCLCLLCLPLSIPPLLVSLLLLSKGSLMGAAANSEVIPVQSISMQTAADMRC